MAVVRSSAGAAVLEFERGGTLARYPLALAFRWFAVLRADTEPVTWSSVSRATVQRVCHHYMYPVAAVPGAAQTGDAPLQNNCAKRT